MNPAPYITVRGHRFEVAPEDSGKLWLRLTDDIWSAFGSWEELIAVVVYDLEYCHPPEGFMSFAPPGEYQRLEATTVMPILHVEI